MDAIAKIVSRIAASADFAISITTTKPFAFATMDFSMITARQSITASSITVKTIRPVRIQLTEPFVNAQTDLRVTCVTLKTFA